MMASSTGNKNRSMKVANDQYVYLLAANVNHSALSSKAHPSEL